MRKRKKWFRWSAVAMFGTLLLFSPQSKVSAADWKPENPTVSSEGVSTWDCIYFGNYWQNDTNGDGVANEQDEKEPIKWRVLSVNGDDVFLVADQNLDVRPYNEIYEEVTWKTCTLRSWLNGYDASLNKTGKDYTQDNFMDAAFNEEEQAAIPVTTVLNISPTDQVVVDTDTNDQVYLLSIEEIMSKEYGFTDSNRFEPGEEVRHCTNTDYVANKPHMAPKDTPTFWWLRSQGKNLWYASFLRTYGFYSQNGINVDVSYIGVRPALHLDLSKTDAYINAGTVSSDGTITKAETEEVTVAKLMKNNVVQEEKTVSKVKASASKVKLNKTKLTLKKGKNYKLKASMNPTKSTDKLKWKSSNKKIATVTSAGLVKAKKKGKVDITVTTTSGATKKCKVTVK